MPKRIGNLRWGIVSLLVAPITFVMTLDRAAMTIAAPTIQKELGLSLVEMSVILTIYFWTYALGQIPAGRLAERHGSRKVLFGTSALWSLMMIVTPFGVGFNWLVGCRALLGGAQSADWSSGVLAVKRWFPKNERAKGNSFLLGGLYLGPIISAPLTAWMILQFGWHSVFYVFGAIGLVLGIAWWFGYRDVPARHPLITPEEATYIAAGQSEPEAVAKGVFLRCLRHPRFWLFGIQYFLLVLIQSFYTTWLPTYLMRARGLSLKSMGFAASLPWIAVFVAVFVAGIVCDKILKRTQSVWAARAPVAMVGFLVSAIALCLASWAVNIAAVIGFLCLSFAAVGFVQVVVWSAAQDLARDFTGVMSGWTNLWGAASNVAGPVAVAFMVKLTGNWGSALVVIALAAAVGTVLWLFVHPEKPLFDIPQAAVAAPSKERVRQVASNSDLTSDLTSDEARP
ncbi:MFS transporter [Caballeronia sordidicola]|uniref:Major facilitator superfamily protein n=1 Tax=Caballeronia sordidicola TaxID=196367 RepID=A0A226X192_CABSO|nr:MFS transporter [Caballeronia sordidicola]OXC76637.1 putative glucarate transporter [Caballeronia sordidicola]OXC77226.1 major facilitator superfamily protein [Caballeronia sordidicola]